MKEAPLRSIGRGLAVLQAINAGGSLTMMQIARAVDLPYPTTARIVMTLVQEGMVEREVDQKLYRATALVCTLSQGYGHHSRYSEITRPCLVDLTNKFGWVSAFSTRVGLNMMVRECTHSISPFTLSIYHPGFLYPLWRSAAGLAYVSALSAQERDLARRALPSDAPVGDSALIGWNDEATIARIQSKGYATGARNDFTAPLRKNSAIAAPVFVDGRVAGALSLIFLAAALKMEKAESLYGQPLVEMASAIGSALSRSNSDP